MLVLATMGLTRLPVAPLPVGAAESVDARDRGTGLRPVKHIFFVRRENRSLANDFGLAVHPTGRTYATLMITRASTPDQQAPSQCHTTREEER